MTSTRSICPYCGVGCGIVATSQADSSKPLVSISGDKDHPSNHGRLCSKGADLAVSLQAPHRLLTPMILGQRASWDEATAEIASRFQQTIETHGPGSVAFYVSGQLLTEDYYVVNKFTKGWLGTANIDTNSRLCMASSVTGHKRAFGSDTVPGCYEDLELADLVVLVGSNLAWCHPVLYQRVRAARESRPGMRLVVIDPRRSATADEADLHLAIKPDADVLLFNALLVHLAKTNSLDEGYLQAHVNGFDESLNAASDSIPPDSQTSSLCNRLGISESDWHEFSTLYESTEKTVTVYSQGVNQSVTGSDKVNAIINCHLATGRIGKPGMGPFSITGQPNAMGGREVGGLATMLACHMDLNNRDHQDIVQRFWQSPAIACQMGLTAVDMFDAVADGSIKAIWIMATNPVDSMPDADHVERALANCPLVVVSDVSSATDTIKHAHIALPAQPFGEKNGTVTNSERRISRMRCFNSALNESRPDWWAICEVAKRMGYTDAFNYASAAEIFREYASLSGFENNGQRDFDISAYCHISDAEYDMLEPFQWPQALGSSVKINTQRQTDTRPVRFFGQGHFYTTSHKANMLPITNRTDLQQDNGCHAEQTLNTGRVRDQWHTMTRTGYSPRLMSHMGEPYAEISLQLAEQRNISTGDIVKVSGRQGLILVRALVGSRQVGNDVFVPMHWNRQFASLARVDSIVDSRQDPASRQPAFKNQSVNVNRFHTDCYAYALATADTNLDGLHGIEYWAKAPVDGGWQWELAGTANPKAMLDTLASQMPCLPAEERSVLCRLEYRDIERQEHRIAFFAHDRLIAIIYVSSRPVGVSRSWAIAQLCTDHRTIQERWKLLAGRPTADLPDKGAIVCSCLMVGEKDIERAVLWQHCHTVASVSNCTQAGTNCGSCRSDIKRIIQQLEPAPLDERVA